MRKHREIYLHSIRMSVQCIRTSVQCIQAKTTWLPTLISEPLFYDDLVYKFKGIVGKSNFSDQFIKIVKRYIRVGYNLDVMRQSACLVLNPITVYSYGFLFNCTTVGQATDSMTALTKSFHQWVSAWCLSVAGPAVAQLDFFLTRLSVSHEPFSLFHHGVLIWLECFTMMIHCIS